MKKIKEIHALIKDSEFSTKIKLFFGARTYSDSYDPETNNYSTTFSNPITIKGLVRHLTPESTIWKVYGTYTDGAVEIITSKKFTQNFRDCQKITIDDIEYSVSSI